MADKKFNIDTWLVYQLRRLSLRWPPRYKALAKSKQGYNQYECSICKKIVPSKEKELNHKSPVVPLDRSIYRKEEPTRRDFNLYIDRLFVEEDGFECVCIPCHDKLTAEQNKIRLSNNLRPEVKRKKKSGPKTKAKKSNP